MIKCFRDRIDAGSKLAGLLAYIKSQEVIVYALPRGRVGAYYENFSPVEDEDIIRIMSAPRKAWYS